MQPSVRKLCLSRRSWVFRQDNGGHYVWGKHTTQNAQECGLEWPAKSPDLKPIEHLWKLAVGRQQPSNLRELEQFAQEELLPPKATKY